MEACHRSTAPTCIVREVSSRSKRHAKCSITLVTTRKAVEIRVIFLAFLLKIPDLLQVDIIYSVALPGCTSKYFRCLCRSAGMSRKEQHRDENERLRRLIQSWNQTRVELFKISRPKEVSIMLLFAATL